jgi:hypothetical protein
VSFFTATDFFELFPKKDLTDGGQTKAHDGQTKTDGKSVSKLTLLVKNSHNQPKNPFAHYGKFDGEVWQKFLCRHPNLFEYQL